MKGPPESTKVNLTSRLNAHARAHWPILTRVQVRFRAGFAYIDGLLADGTTIKLCRLRYGGSAHHWGFAIYRASHDDYEDSILPTGTFTGTAQDALDCAANLYLNAPE
jgi:choline dehydrogenase-like flavoprotein